MPKIMIKILGLKLMKILYLMRRIRIIFSIDSVIIMKGKEVFIIRGIMLFLLNKRKNNNKTLISSIP